MIETGTNVGSSGLSTEADQLTELESLRRKLHTTNFNIEFLKELVLRQKLHISQLQEAVEYGRGKLLEQLHMQGYVATLEFEANKLRLLHFATLKIDEMLVHDTRFYGANYPRDTVPSQLIENIDELPHWIDEVVGNALTRVTALRKELLEKREELRRQQQLTETLETQLR